MTLDFAPSALPQRPADLDFLGSAGELLGLRLLRLIARLGALLCLLVLLGALSARMPSRPSPGYGSNSSRYQPSRNDSWPGPRSRDADWLSRRNAQETPPSGAAGYVDRVLGPWLPSLSAPVRAWIDRVSGWARQLTWRLPFRLPDIPLGAAAFGLLVCILVSRALGKAISLYRIRHTYVYGQPLDYSKGCAAFIHRFVNALIIIFTLGLGGPWVAARIVQYRWKCTHLRANRAVTLDHNGPVGDWYVMWLLSMLAAPFIVITLGLLAFPLIHMQIAWEQGHIIVPGPDGRRYQTRYTGTWTDYMGTVIVGALLTMITLGFYGPWATVARWRWIARHTHVPPIGPEATLVAQPVAWQQAPMQMAR